MRLYTIDHMFVSLNDSHDLAGEFIPDENMPARQRDGHFEVRCGEQKGLYPQSEPDMTWLSDQKLASFIIVRALRWPSNEFTKPRLGTCFRQSSSCVRSVSRRFFLPVFSSEANVGRLRSGDDGWVCSSSSMLLLSSRCVGFSPRMRAVCVSVDAAFVSSSGSDLAPVTICVRISLIRCMKKCCRFRRLSPVPCCSVGGSDGSSVGSAVSAAWEGRDSGPMDTKVDPSVTVQRNSVPVSLQSPPSRSRLICTGVFFASVSDDLVCLFTRCSDRHCLICSCDEHCFGSSR